MCASSRTAAFVCALCAVIAAFADGVVQVSLSTNDLSYDRVSGTLFASVPSTGGAAHGNHLVGINPFTGAIVSSVFVGSEPQKLAVSDDGQYVYVDLDGAAAIRRYHIPSATAGLQFTLGNSGSTGPMYAEDIEVMPGNADVIAVSRQNKGFSPRHEGVAIYENGIMRPQTTPGHTGSNVIAFSSNPDRLYGYNNETTEFGFRRMVVDPNGVHTLDATDNLISGFGVDIRYDKGLIYSTSGRVIDPEARLLLGTFQGSGLVAPDSSVNRAFFLTGSGSNATVKSFNETEFTPLDTLTIPGISGSVGSFLRWGSDGLAFRTTGGQVFIVRSSIVPEPAAALLLAGTVLMLRPSRRGAGKSRRDGRALR